MTRRWLFVFNKMYNIYYIYYVLCILHCIVYLNIRACGTCCEQHPPPPLPGRGGKLFVTYTIYVCILCVHSTCRPLLRLNFYNLSQGLINCNAADRRGQRGGPRPPAGGWGGHHSAGGQRGSGPGGGRRGGALPPKLFAGHHQPDRCVAPPGRPPAGWPAAPPAAG